MTNPIKDLHQVMRALPSVSFLQCSWQRTHFCMWVYEPSILHIPSILWVYEPSTSSPCRHIVGVQSLQQLESALGFSNYFLYFLNLGP